MNSPITLFAGLYSEQLSQSKDIIPSACCLSSIGTDGFPNARFVSLKELADGKFIVCGPTKSRKGIEIDSNNKVSLTFWWPETKRQVRIQGMATSISDEQADRYFSERDRESQLVSSVSNQGENISALNTLLSKFESLQNESEGKLIRRPQNWGGFSVDPIRVEFLEFKNTRFHERKLFTLENGSWKTTFLQP